MALSIAFFQAEPSESWPLFREYVTPVLSRQVAPYTEGVVLLLLALLLLTALLYILVPSLGWQRVNASLSLNAGDNTKGRDDSMLPQVLLQCEGGLLFAILLETLYSDVTGLYAETISQYWLRIGLFSCGVALLYLLAWLFYRLTLAIFFTPEQARTWWVSYYTLTSLWSLALFLPMILLYFAALPIIIVLGLLLLLWSLYRVFILVRTLQIFPQAFSYPLHLFLYLCGREIAPPLFVWNYFSQLG